ncbi:MAG TPA: hypothetical protein VFO10_04915 [Oligoflexus sp.]|uniref:hypothetical protein n=1 Tax=Oligoflexus sp. TaxID=1971216 RepID=UPI002D7E2749|nr:hypothetical protein [Oligoflexus sp.]HET9236565.1 hypothetical protein [Oligoflexus sp.]
MSNRHTSESSQPAPESAKKPRITQASAGRLLLLRRRKPCKTCGRVHGPPQETCRTTTMHTDDSTVPDDGHLPWIF